jgi:hypothetical protein
VQKVAGRGAGLSGDGGLPSAEFAAPADVVVAANGDVYVADADDNMVRVIGGGEVDPFAGTGGTCPGAALACGDGGTAVEAYLAHPSGLALDGSGNLYIADSDDNRVRMVDANTHTITTVAGDGAVCGAPLAGCGDGGNATDAHLSHPVGVAVHGGDLYIADRDDSRIRKVHAGTISTVAGDGSNGTAGDGGDATAADVSCPTRLAFDSDGDLFISEGCDTSVIRRVDHNSGHISTVAGVSGSGEGGDLGGALGAHFGGLGGLAFDDNDNLYVVAPSGDGTVSRIRKIVGPL